MFALFICCCDGRSVEGCKRDKESREAAQLRVGQQNEHVGQLSACDSAKWGSVVTLRWLYRIARNIADKLNTIELKSSLTKLDSDAGTHRKLRLQN